MGNGSNDYIKAQDFADILARIERSQEETRKLVAEARKFAAERREFDAERTKPGAERSHRHGLTTEQATTLGIVIGVVMVLIVLLLRVVGILH